MQIRAAVLEEFGEPLVVQEVELAGPRAGEVLVRLHACGVCHTDLYTASGADPSGYAPCVLGHEGAGVVEAVGDGVSSVAVGDHVVTLFNPFCGECVNCASGKTNVCVAIREQQSRGYLPDGTTRLSRDGDELRHFMGCSTFAEATVMPEIALAKVSPDASLEACALFACGLSTGLGAAMYRAEVEEGSTCVVFGAGMVGLGAVAGCRLQGAERIICVDLSEERLALARAARRDRHVDRRRRRRRPHRRGDRRLRRGLHVRGDRPRRRSCARPSKRRGWAGVCAPSPVWRARARFSRSCRGS